MKDETFDVEDLEDAFEGETCRKDAKDSLAFLGDSST